MNHPAEKVARAFALSAMAIGMKPPTYPKPKFWQIKQRLYLRHLRKAGLPHTVEGKMYGIVQE